jgi:hypothetical protein
MSDMPAKWKAIYLKLQRGSWSKAELEWVRDHVLDGTEPAQLRWLLGAKLQRFLEEGQHA